MTLDYGKYGVYALLWLMQALYHHIIWVVVKNYGPFMGTLI